MGTVKKLNIRRILSFTGLILVCAIIATTYQNCSAPPPEGEVGGASSAFPFESRIDHIAYMSCSNMPSGYNTNAFFTFKVGAYDAGSGVRLSPSYARSSLDLTVSDAVNDLVNHKEYSNTFLALALRSPTNFGANQNGNLYANDFVALLNDVATATEFMNSRRTNPYINVFTSKSNARLEDTIHFTNNETNAAAARANLISGGELLSVTFNNGNTSTDTLYPSGSGAMGTGYRINFGYGFGQSSAFVGTPGPNRIMSSVQEMDLGTRTNTSSAWDCPGDWTFMIMKTADLGVRAFCEYSTAADAVPTAGQTAMFQALRKVLPYSDWYVNLNRRCIVPRQPASCYGNSAAAVNYAGGSCDPAAGTCPHYVSICKRR